MCFLNRQVFNIAQKSYAYTPPAIFLHKSYQLFKYAKPECPKLGQFPTSVNKTSDSNDLCWLLAALCGITRSMVPDTEQSVAGPSTWSALNSIISKPLPLTRLSTPPLIAAAAHEFPHC